MCDEVLEHPHLEPIINIGFYDHDMDPAEGGSDMLVHFWGVRRHAGHRLCEMKYTLR